MHSDAVIAAKTINMKTSLGLILATEAGIAVTVLTVIGTEPGHLENNHIVMISIFTWVSEFKVHDISYWIHRAHNHQY